MAIISDEKLKEIYEKVFGLNCYDFEHHTFIDVDKATGKPFSFEQKYMALMILKVANTEEGSRILSQLSLDQPVDLIFDPKSVQECNGWSGGHTIAITDIGRDITLNASTFLHELTHEVQAQSGSNELELVTEQDRFMVNKMCEAEARLETVIGFCEIYINQKRANPNTSLPEEMTDQLKKDITQYLELKNAGMTPEEIRETMLKSFFQDDSWNAAYNVQATRFAYSKYDKKRASFKHGKSAEEVMTVFMERNGLSKEAGDYFLNPDNISKYPKDKILAKSTKEHKGTESNLVQIYEGGVLVCQEIRNDEGKVLRSSRYGEDGSIVESKDYDLNGDLKSKTAYVDGGRICAVYNNGQLEQEVYYGNKNEILGVVNAQGERVSNGFSLEPIRKQGIDLYTEIRTSQQQNKSVNTEALAEKAGMVLHDTYALFPATVVKTVAEEVLRQNEALKRGNLQISAENAEKLQMLAADIKEMAPNAALRMAQKIEREPKKEPVQEDKQPVEKVETITKPNEHVEAGVKPVEKTEEKPAVEVKAPEAEVETVETINKRIDQYAKGMQFWGDVFRSQSFGQPLVVENFAEQAEQIIKNDSLGFTSNVVEDVAKAVLKRDKQVRDGLLQVSPEEAQALTVLAGDVRQKMPDLAQSMDAKLERSSLLAGIGGEKNQYALGMDVWGKAFMAESFGEPLVVENFAQKAAIVIYNDEAKFLPTQIDVVARAVLKQDKLVREGQLQVSSEEAQALTVLVGEVRQKMPELAQKMDMELGQQPQQTAEKPAVEVKAPEAAVTEPVAKTEEKTTEAETAVQSSLQRVRGLIKPKEDKRSSEEVILDTLLEKGNLSKEQENKLIEIATEVEHNRLRFQGKNNFAEQVIDKIAQSDIFTEKQKSIALDAAIIQEKKERKQPTAGVVNAASLAKQSSAVR